MSPWVVVGLGNPGPAYAGNRHNVGAMVIDELASRSRESLRRHKSRVAATSVRLGHLAGGAPGPAAVIGVPSSYMNESGGPVKALLGFYGAGAESLIVVHDDLDIAPGEVRLKLGGGEGGHNGLRSISSALGSRDYYRVRIGIGRPPGRMDAADYVLKDFTSAQRKDLPLVIAEAADAVELLASQGLTAAQQRFHAPPESR